MLLMGGRLVFAGLAIGVAASLASTRLLRSQLFRVQPADPLVSERTRNPEPGTGANPEPAT
jgi:hypothetical protein